jgi:lauroyl/myristoyl acyltransferase
MKQTILPGREATAHRVPFTRVSTSDLAAMAKLLALGMVSWLVPVNWLWQISRSIGRATAFWHRDTSPEKFIRGLRDAHDVSWAARDIHQRYQDHVREERLVVLALNRPGRRWQPSVRWHGLDHLRSALEQGSGVILWVGGFAHHQLISLMALRQADFAVHQLARPEHGFLTSPFGIRWFNRLWTRIERRFIAEAVVILKNDAGPALQLLRQRLGANGIVWIAVGPEARRTLDVPFLGGTIRLPTGPLHLARVSRAALLPVFTIRANDGTYNVTIERQLDVDTDITYASAARSYVAMLEPYVTAHPDQWGGWETLIVPQPTYHNERIHARHAVTAAGRHGGGSSLVHLEGRKQARDVPPQEPA